MSGGLGTRQQAVAAAATTWLYACQLADSMSPRELAEAAWHVGGRTVDDLEAEIRELRGLPQHLGGVA